MRLDEVDFMADPARALTALARDVSKGCVAAMRSRARAVALAFFASTAGLAKGLAATLAARGLGCAGRCLRDGGGGDGGGDGSGGAGAESAGDNGGGGRGYGGGRGGRGGLGSLAVWPEVALGPGAAVCLPPRLRAAALPGRVAAEETTEGRRRGARKAAGSRRRNQQDEAGNRPKVEAARA